jgi:hypothetical protein
MFRLQLNHLQGVKVAVITPEDGSTGAKIYVGDIEQYLII